MACGMSKGMPLFVLKFAADTYSNIALKISNYTLSQLNQKRTCPISVTIILFIIIILIYILNLCFTIRQVQSKKLIFF